MNNKKSVAAIIQARMSSSRLPGKVMEDINGRPMLHHVLKRAMRSKMIDFAVVATSEHESDNVIESFCRELGVACFRGSLQDVLDRYYRAASQYSVAVIVRLTADCPLLDPNVIDRTVQTFMEGNYDYVSNVISPSYPDGLDTEVFSYEALYNAWREAGLKSEREHVTPYIYKHPEIFHLANVPHSEDLSHMRWTVDEQRDADFVRSIFCRFNDEFFTMEDILDLLGRHPELMRVNAEIEKTAGYTKSLREDCASVREVMP